MPGFLTHYIFSVQAASILKRKELANAIKRHESVYYLGAQGPDLFLYYLPCNLSKEKKLGSKMHKLRTNAFFANCIEELSKLDSIQEEDILLSYVAGFLSHYTLDSQTHPFIYARTEYPKYEKSPLNYTSRHISYETIVDTNILIKYCNLVPSKVNYASIVSLSRNEIFCLSKFLTKVINQTYFNESSHSYVTEHFIRRAIRSMPTELRFLKDRTGYKKSAIRWLENRTIKYPLLSSMISIDNPYVTLDVLNTSHSEWISPWEQDITHKESFLDLFELAIPQCARRMDDFYTISKATLHPAHYKETLNHLLSDLKNLSYNTGIPCKE